MLGKASEIKTTVIYEFDRPIECEINDFLAGNHSIEIIDIKYSTHSYQNGEVLWSVKDRALIIFKEAGQ